MTKLHSQSTWDDIVRECRHHDDPLIRLIMDRAEEQVDAACDADERVANNDDLPFDDVNGLIEGAGELVEWKSTVREELDLEPDAGETLSRQIEQYVSAAEDLADLDAVCVANLPSLTPGAPVEQVQHEFDRERELRNEAIFQRDFYRMLVSAK